MADLFPKYWHSACVVADLLGSNRDACCAHLIDFLRGRY